MWRRQNGADGAAEVFIVRDRLMDERQTLPAGCRQNQGRIDVGYVIAEPMGIAGTTVVRFVGVEHKSLTPDAVSSRASVGEGLNTACRDADRVGIVAMPRE